MDPHASREEDALRDWEHLFSSYAEVRQGIRVLGAASISHNLRSQPAVN